MSTITLFSLILDHYIKKYLKERNKRNLLLFVAGINLFNYVSKTLRNNMFFKGEEDRQRKKNQDKQDTSESTRSIY